MSKVDAYDEKSNEMIEGLIDEYVQKFYSSTGEEIVRIRHNIWAIREVKYSFNIIITSLLVIFDAVLFKTLPKNKHQFFEELLILNAHRAKSSKLCLIKGTIHLRIIRGLEDFDYSEFVDHVEEYRELFPEIEEQLMDKYFSEDE